jgi:2-methylcitrate dehydratase PrpD
MSDAPTVTTPPDERAPTVTASLAAFASELRFEDLPPAVVDHVERLVLDTLGCALGGSQTPLGDVAVRFADAGAGGSDEASVASSGRRTTALLAAGANGRMAGALDADDTFASAGQTSHHGAPTVAAAFALAERDGASGRDLLTAVAAGYEVGARFGVGVPAHDLVPRPGGWKVGGGAAGVLGPAAATARLLGLDADTIAHTLGIAGAHIDVAPLKWFEGSTAPMVKSMDNGWSASAGLSAALLAQLGMTGHRDILDGPNGLWRALGHQSFDFEAAAADLGTRWWTLDASFKLWPCQYWMQGALRAFDQILLQHDLAAADIEAIVLRTNSRSGAPRFRDQHPEGFVTGQFNFPHTAAMLALRVPPGPRWFDDAAFADPEVAALREKVEVEIDPRTEAGDDLAVDGMLRRMPGSASVTARGRVYEASVDAGFGGPWDDDTRLDDTALATKLADMVGPLADRDPVWHGRAEVLSGLTGLLRGVPDVRAVGELLRPA